MEKIHYECKVSEVLFRLFEGDLTLRPVDAIVNAANTHLQHGGGVAGAIVQRGGQIIQDESDRIGYTAVGTAVITSAGVLPAKHVIHTVGPRMGEGDEDAKLASAMRSVLDLADKQGFQSISVPAISAGIYGFPKDRCAGILVTEARRWVQEHPGTTLRSIEFCVFSSEMAAYFLRALQT